jgi:cell fate (sporulation/competence/biofilm development) regulator YlbF (YheA/YmcA/DUF963 family)
MMFATSETVQIIDDAEGLANMIIFSELGEQYRYLYKKLKNDREAQQIISEFVKAKDQFEDVQRFGKYHPDYQKIRKEMRDRKLVLDMNETITSFKKVERELQKLLDEVSVIIAHEVSTFIKVPTGNPFFEQSCSTGGGGCASGGSCGCKTR